MWPLETVQHCGLSKGSKPWSALCILLVMPRSLLMSGQSLKRFFITLRKFPHALSSWEFLFFAGNVARFVNCFFCVLVDSHDMLLLLSVEELDCITTFWIVRLTTLGWIPVAWNAPSFPVLDGFDSGCLAPLLDFPEHRTHVDLEILGRILNLRFRKRALPSAGSLLK